MDDIKIFRSSYAIKLHSNTFLWRPAAPSGKVHFISYNTAL